LSRLEPERLERDLNLGDPSLIRNACGRIPDAVPVEAQPFAIVRDLPIRPCTRRIDLKEETVSVIEERVEDDRDSIVDIEIRKQRVSRQDALLPVLVLNILWVCRFVRDELGARIFYHDLFEKQTCQGVTWKANVCWMLVDHPHPSVSMKERVKNVSAIDF